MQRASKKVGKIQASRMIAAAAAGVTLALSAASAGAATVTWTGTTPDPNLANYTLNTTTLEGYTAGDPIYIWSTTGGNVTPGNYAVGDTIVFNDTFAGGRYIRPAGNMNPAVMRFADNGGTPVHYTFLRSTDFTGTGYGSSTPFGANHDTTLLLDTGFDGKVTLRQGGVAASSGANSFTIIRSGVLEIADNNQLPNNGNNNQFPNIELGGGELRFSYGLTGAAEPASTQYRGILTVSENSLLTGNGIDTTPGTTLNRVYGDGGIVNIAAGKVLTLKSLTGVILRFGGNMTGAGNLGTFRLEDAPGFQTRVQLGQGTSESVNGLFDLGTGTSILETRDQSATTTIDFGALTGGAGTTLRGSANNANVITYSVGARGDNTTFAGSITNGAGSGGTAVTALTKVGTGTLTLTGAGTQTGVTTVSAGTLAVTGAGTIAAAPIAINSNATLRIDNTGTNNNNRLPDALATTMNQGNLVFVGNRAAPTAELAGQLAIAGGSNNVQTQASGAGGTASVTFDNLNRTGGVVNFQPAAGVNIAFTNQPALTNNIIGAYATVNGTDWATISSGSVAAYSGYANNTAPGTWVAADNVNLTAGGLVTVAASTTVNSLRFSDASTNLSIAAGQTLNLGSGGLLTVQLPLQTIAGQGSLTAGAGAAELIANVANASSTLSISAPIADNGTGAVKLVKAGPGKLILSGSGSTYTGGTDLIGGTLQVGVANFFPAGSNLTVNYGTAFDIGGFNQTFGTVAVIDGSVLNSGGGGAGVTATAYDVRNGTISAALGGTGALTKTSGTGTITLSSANTYSGGTTISAGTLIAGAANALPAGGALTVNGGSTLNIGAFNQSVGAVVLGNTTTNAGTITGTSGFITGTSWDLQNGTVSANIAGTAGVTKAGINTTVTLSGASTYTGPTTITSGTNAGTLAITTIANGGAASSIGASTNAASNLVLGGGSVLSYTGTGGSTDRLFSLVNGNAQLANNGTGALSFTNTGAIQANFGNLTLGGSNTGNNTFAPRLSQADSMGALIKSGGGTWVITNNTNDFVSPVTFSGGILSVNMLANSGSPSPIGAGADSSTVLNGGTLRYTGTGHSTNRQITLNNNGGLEASGTGPVSFTNSGNVAGPGTALTLTLSGTNTGANTLASNIINGTALTKTGAGTWVVSGANTYTGATTVNGGTLRQQGSQTTTASVTVTGANAKLEVASNGSFMRVLKTPTVAITNGGRIDLKDNKLITTTTAVGTANASGVYNGLQGLVQSAYNFGSWDQPGLMTSEPNAGPLVGTHTIGVSNGEAVLFIAPTATGTFAGQTVTGSSAIAVYTYAGDLNFDGLVDGGDYGVIDNSFQFPGTTGYANGDFNYDGIIDGGDYGIIDNTFSLQGAPIPMAGGVAGAESLSGVTAVPEPASLSVLGIAAASLLGRRRRRQE